MIPAERKKRENISEYIIHMYQSEDLIRAFDFDLNQITTYVIQHIPEKDQEKKELILWYADLILKMKAEGLEESGHLSQTQQFVKQLVDLKHDLLQEDEEFQKVWQESLSSIETHRKESNENEIQICLNGIYGLLLLRLNGKPVSDEMLKKADDFGKVLSYLTYKYTQRNLLNGN